MSATPASPSPASTSTAANVETAARAVAAGGGMQAVVDATGLRTRENVLAVIDPAILDRANRTTPLHHPPPSPPSPSRAGQRLRRSRRQSRRTCRPSARLRPRTKLVGKRLELLPHELEGITGLNEDARPYAQRDGRCRASVVVRELLASRSDPTHPWEARRVESDTPTVARVATVWSASGSSRVPEHAELCRQASVASVLQKRSTSSSLL